MAIWSSVAINMRALISLESAQVTNTDSDTTCAYLLRGSEYGVCTRVEWHMLS